MNKLPMPINTYGAAPSKEEVVAVKDRMDKMWKGFCNDQTIQQLRFNNDWWYKFYTDREKA
jgi:hypothetical protein